MIEDRDNEVVLLSSIELKFPEGLKAQLLVKNCSNSTISAKYLLGSVRLQNIKNCKVLLAPCCTSVYLDNCVNCTIFITCHQLRIHTCTNCFLYVLVNSHPIIEDCSNIGFAPYCLSYDTIKDDFEVSEILFNMNNNNLLMIYVIITFRSVL
jgi:hypothetical protein